QVDSINLTPDALALLSEIDDPTLRETVRDYCVNRFFRTDIFIRGARRLSPLICLEALAVQAFVLVAPPHTIAYKFQLGAAEVELQKEIYEPLIAALASNGHSPKTLGWIMDQLARGSVTQRQLIEALLVLVGTKLVEPAGEATKPARQRCAALNRHICELARSGDEIARMASPVTGSGISVTRDQQLFVLAMQRGLKLPAEQAAFMWKILAAHGQNIVKDGKELTTAEENLAELTARATAFAQEHLPIFKAVGIA